MKEEIFILESGTPEIHGKEKKSFIYKQQPTTKQGLYPKGSCIVISDLNTSDNEPVILSGQHHKVTPFVRHYNDKIKHRGRDFTDRTTRSVGWNVRTKHLISSDTHKYVTFRQLRKGPSTSSRLT